VNRQSVGHPFVEATVVDGGGVHATAMADAADAISSESIRLEHRCG
jgi:hypothetical protein